MNIAQDKAPPLLFHILFLYFQSSDRFTTLIYLAPSFISNTAKGENLAKP